jgi:hypothetical protein
MSHSNGVISAPVTISDAMYTLGSTASNLSALCKSDKVNMWSRIKPIEYPSVAPDRSSRLWWQGASGHCGLNYDAAVSTSVRTVNQLFTDDKLNGWAREDVPSSYYRLLDFNGYSADALPPLRDFAVTTLVSKTGNLSVQCVENVKFDTTDATSPGSVSFDDINVFVDGTLYSLSNLYFGIVVYDTDGNFRIRRTASSPGIFVFDVPMAGASLYLNTDYVAYPILSSVAYSSDTEADKAGVYIALPGLAAKSFRVVTAAVSAGLNVSVFAVYEYFGETRSGISVTIEYYKTSGTMSLENNYIHFRKQGNSYTDTLTSGEYSKSIGTLSVTEDVQTYSFTFMSGNGFSKSIDYTIYVTLGSADYVFTTDIFTPAS